MKNSILKIKNNLYTFVIAFIGIMMRFCAMLFANPYVFQHDVDEKYEHMDYAVYIFKNWRLPNTNIREFAQPPLNAILQAIFMKFTSLFSNANLKDLYAQTKVLSFLYSSLTLLIIYKILSEFDLSKKIRHFVFAIIALYPGLIVMSSQYGNDNLSYMFFYLSLLLSIKWAKNQDLKTIVLLAISIGVGMMSKISVGLIAFLTGPMMLLILIKSKDKKKIFVQLLVFSVIVFPLGLAFPIRNYIKFNQPIGYIYEVAKGKLLDMRRYNYSVFDRYLSLPLSRLLNGESGIYHYKYEYNIWVDLIKTSTFDEFDFSFLGINWFFTVLLLLNFVFYIVGIITTIKLAINLHKIKTDFNIICLLLFALSIFAYLFFNIKYPYSCNSNYRYISYITFSLAGSIASSVPQK